MNEVEPTEVWTPVRSFVGLYSVSSAGRVRSERSGRLMKPYSESRRRYPFVMLTPHDMVPKRCYVHRLVADAFCPGRSTARRHVSHLDGDSWNNSFGNLKWVTPSENLLHGNRALGRGVFGERSHFAKLDAERVAEIRRLHAAGIATREIAKRFTISRTTVLNVALRRSWVHL